MEHLVFESPTWHKEEKWNIGNKQVLTGSNGYVWFERRTMAIEKIDIKVEGEFRRCVVAGDPRYISRSTRIHG